ncbi:MAG: amidase [Actinomycetota bacterium]
MTAVADHITQTLDYIAASQAELNAFITVDRAGALAAAAAADERRASGTVRGPLDGQAVAVKDNLDTAGLATTYGLGVFQGRVPTTDAAVVAQLREAGAIIVGKTNMTELACGTVGINVHYGDVRNPLRAGHYPGGSSSGSAAAVAAGLVSFAIGSDTGGSIRHPASTCGIVGHKPTFGRVSNDGASVCTRSMDHIGPMTANVADAAALLAVIQTAGHDDPTARLGQPLDGASIGLLRGDFVDRCDDDVMAAFEPVVALLEALGCTVTDLDLGLDLRAVDDDIATVLGADLVHEYGEVFAHGGHDAFGPELWEWYSRYERVDPVDYRAAEASQRALSSEVSNRISAFDAVICPTTRTGTRTVLEGEAADRFERVGNLALWDVTGHPSLTMPFGTDRSGLPLGLLISGPLGADAGVLQIGHQVESARSVR